MRLGHEPFKSLNQVVISPDGVTTKPKYLYLLVVVLMTPLFSLKHLR